MAKTNDLPRSETGLYWSEDGRYECERHTPYYGSDTWRMMRYEPMPIEAVQESIRCGYGVPKCEHCGKEARSVLVCR